jgi:anti-sigma28 factor (negative regulator of flagellin synthesis)
MNEDSIGPGVAREHQSNAWEPAMNINGIGNSSPVQRIVTNPVRREVAADGTTTNSRPADKLELSGVSHLMRTLKKNDIRTDKVAQIKAQIEAGTYETGDKLDIATDRLLDDLNK